MKVIGITGGVGAGKSSVLALLKEMCSCDIIQADLVARNIYQSGNIGFEKVVDIFGEQIVGEDGEINRPLLADIIFKNPNKRIVLNSIIHPLVKQEIINMIIHNFKILCIMAINYSLVKLASKFGDKAGVPKFYARAQMNESISLK